MIMKTVNYWFI